MAEQEPKTLEQMDPKPNDDLLALDQMIAAEDPEFATEMGDVQAVGIETDVIIEASAIDAEDDAKDDDKKENFFKRLLNRTWYKIRINCILFVRNLRYIAKDFAHWAIEQIKTQVPILIKATTQFLKNQAKAFAKLSTLQKISLVSAIALCAVMYGLLKMNLKGQWIPLMDLPELKRFSQIADHEVDIGEEKEFVPLYLAFSLPQYEFLLPKFKCNLRPTAEHAWPMAAMELIITLDSRDTAIEMKDREAAVFDRVQRVIEGMSYEQMSNPIGKEHLKTLVKKNLNTILTQGWVEEVNYKTLVIKP